MRDAWFGPSEQASGAQRTTGGGQLSDTFAGQLGALRCILRGPHLQVATKRPPQDRL